MSKSKLRSKKNAALGGKGKVNKAAGAAGSSSGAAGPSTVDAASLIDKSHTLLAQSNFELAIKFLMRALSLEPNNMEARELVGIAELEGGDPDAGRAHLLQLFPPHTAESPSTPSPYLYLAQSAEDPHEALGYYSAGASIIEKKLAVEASKGKGRQIGVENGNSGELEEERAMAVRCLVAMIEIWMSDLCMEEAAEANCDALITRALSVAPQDPEVRLSLASIRMSQSRFDEAKAVAVSLYEEIKNKEPFDSTLPSFPARLSLARLMLEHNLHLEALDLLTTAREEDELNVEAAYLEGWAWYLRAEAILENPALQISKPPPTTNEQSSEEGEEEVDGAETMSVEECFTESMMVLLEAAKIFTEQDHPDQGIAEHIQELLQGLEKRGIKPVEVDEDEEGVEGDNQGWEDVEDVEMA